MDPQDDSARTGPKPGHGLVGGATRPPGAAGAVDLYWLPLGAGDHVVKRFGRLYETVVAAREHQSRATCITPPSRCTSTGPGT